MLDTAANRVPRPLDFPLPPSGVARWARKGFSLPFAADIPHQLDSELARLPRQAQRTLGWRIWRRNAWLHLSGHARHARATIPTGARRVLWIYTWTTIGDALMDLSARHLFPAGMQVDLHVAPHLAGLFANDPRFHKIHQGDAVGQDYDFVLVQDLHAASLKLKHKLAPHTPFASMLGFLHGEMFHRVAFAHQRLAQLLGLATPLLRHPQLSGVARPGMGNTQVPMRIALALGARDARRRYPHWPEVMRQMLDRWPAALPKPQFVLLGNGNAHEDFSAIAQTGLLPHCDMQLDCPSLPALARLVASCDAFVGADGGLMHLALALSRPGVALFGPVPAQLRLLSGCSLLPIGGSAGSTGDIARIPPAAVASLALDQLTD